MSASRESSLLRVIRVLIGPCDFLFVPMPIAVLVLKWRKMPIQAISNQLLVNTFRFTYSMLTSCIKKRLQFTIWQIHLVLENLNIHYFWLAHWAHRLGDLLRDNNNIWTMRQSAISSFYYKKMPYYSLTIAWKEAKPVLQNSIFFVKKVMQGKFDHAPNTVSIKTAIEFISRNTSSWQTKSIDK